MACPCSRARNSPGSTEHFPGPGTPREQPGSTKKNKTKRPPRRVSPKPRPTPARREPAPLPPPPCPRHLPLWADGNGTFVVGTLAFQEVPVLGQLSVSAPDQQVGELGGHSHLHVLADHIDGEIVTSILLARTPILSLKRCISVSSDQNLPFLGRS